METKYISDRDNVPEKVEVHVPDDRFQAHIKKLILNKNDKGYKIDATIDEVKSDNFKIMINDGYLNILVALKMVDDAKFGDNYSVIQKCSLLLPDPSFSKITSVRLVNGILKIRLSKPNGSGIDLDDYPGYDDFYDPDF